MAVELAFETLQGALEATRSVAIAAPTHRFNLPGKLTPVIDYYEPPDMLGVLAEIDREEAMRQNAALEASGDADVTKLPFWFNMALAAVSSPTTPAGGTSTRLWTFPRTMTSDDLKSATLWFGDPNVAQYEGPYGMLDEIGFSADSSGTDAVKQTLKGMTHFPDDLTGGAIPAAATLAVGPTLVPGRTQLFIDTVSGIGNTLVSGRFVSAQVTIPTGVTYKYPANGPEGTLGYDHTGRKKTHPEIKVVLEMVDQTQYNLFRNRTTVKMRLRFNGSMIEKVADEVQTLVISGSPAGGTFTVTGTNPLTGITRTTAALAIASTAADVQTALETIFGAGNVSVARTGTTPNWTFTVTFQANLSGIGIAQMSSANTFTGGTAPTVTAGTTTQGTAYYNYVEFDVVGKLRLSSWGDLEGSNRTVEFLVKGNLDSATLSSTDLIARVQCTNTTI